MCSGSVFSSKEIAWRRAAANIAPFWDEMSKLDQWWVQRGPKIKLVNGVSLVDHVLPKRSLLHDKRKRRWLESRTDRYDKTNPCETALRSKIIDLLGEI